MRIKRFSQILNTNNPTLGFTRNRKYDMDLDRLGRMDSSQRELAKTNDLAKESRKLNNELNNGRLGLWQSTD